MTTDIRRPPVTAPAVAIPRWSRLLGLGSVFGKAIRDSRRAFVLEVLFLGGFLLLVLAGIGSAYPTQAARDELVRLANDIGPAAQGIAGKPVNVGTMGGYVEWKYGPVFLLIAAFWSILTLTATLAGEAHRGSLDLVTTSPMTRRRIAIEKVAAHVTLLTVVAVILALAAWLGGVAFAKLPGDAIPPQAAVGFALLGAFGLIMAAGSRSLADKFAKSPNLARTIQNIFPGFDLTTAGGFLQLIVQLLFIVVGFAAATLISGWASDETSGRLELLLSAPLSRRSWMIRSGLGLYAAIALMTVIMAVAIGVGAGAAGSDVFTPMAGTFALGLFAAALAGVGFAVGGLVRSSAAAQVVAAVVIATYLIDLLVPALDLPDRVHELALTAHLGQPMVGHWNAAGVVACLALAAGGLALGGLGFARRDVRG